MNNQDKTADIDVDIPGPIVHMVKKITDLSWGNWVPSNWWGWKDTGYDVWVADKNDSLYDELAKLPTG